MSHKKNKAKKQYTHFNKDNRNEISILLKKGYSHQDIADVVGKDHSSITREINNHSVNGEYNPDKAQHKARIKRLYSKYQGMKIVENISLDKYLKKKMKEFWTPEQIAGRWNKKKHRDKNEKKIIISVPSIYKYLYSSHGQSLCRYLPSRRYHPKKRNGRIKLKKAMIPNRVSIHLRPEAANQRLEFGHFEGDTLGRIKSDQEAITGLIERISRKVFLEKVARLRYAIDGFKKRLNPCHNIAESVTLDNGVENVRHEELNLSTYICDPYSSWQKGSVENTFLRLRRFIPKKESLRNYSAKDISRIEKIMNSTPRKCLNWETPNEVFNRLSNIKKTAI